MLKALKESGSPAVTRLPGGGWRTTRRPKLNKWSQPTEQERLILALIAKVQNNRGIAQEVNSSDKTVKIYASNILIKLEAAAYMAERR
ncbi:MAG TPA: DNA-binding response regulator, partial [Dehalococcoidia bacterium]|nr:DNA-binding response regulator [Dehalococcoidia bacterium]